MQTAYLIAAAHVSRIAYKHKDDQFADLLAVHMLSIETFKKYPSVIC